MRRKSTGGTTAIYTETGRLISAARKAKAITQARLAAAVGLSRTSIANIERGRQKLLLHSLYDIAGALRVRPYELLPPENKAKSPWDQRLPKETPPKVRKWITQLVEKGGATS